VFVHLLSDVVVLAKLSKEHLVGSGPVVDRSHEAEVATMGNCGLQVLLKYWQILG
jgi:hypothetical protein